MITVSDVEAALESENIRINFEFLSVQNRLYNFNIKVIHDKMYIVSVQMNDGSNRNSMHYDNAAEAKDCVIRLFKMYNEYCKVKEIII